MVLCIWRTLMYTKGPTLWKDPYTIWNQFIYSDSDLLTQPLPVGGGFFCTDVQINEMHCEVSAWCQLGRHTQQDDDRWMRCPACVNVCVFLAWCLHRATWISLDAVDCSEAVFDCCSGCHNTTVCQLMGKPLSSNMRNIVKVRLWKQ